MEPTQLVLLNARPRYRREPWRAQPPTGPGRFLNSWTPSQWKALLKNRKSFHSESTISTELVAWRLNVDFFGLVSGQHPRYSALTSWPIFLSFLATSQLRVRSG